MPSFFPTLLAHADIAPLIIRAVLGLTLAYFGYEKAIGKGQSSGSNSAVLGLAEIFVAIFLVIGLYTQIAAVVNALILVIKIGNKFGEGKVLTDGINYYILLLAMAASLIFTGGGAFGLDTFLS